MSGSQEDNPFTDPNYGKDLTSTRSSNPFSDTNYGKEQKKGVLGNLKDTGLSALKGAVAVPELAVGIMDVMSDGAVGKTLENKDGAIGFRPKEAKQALGDLHTDQYKAQQQEFADAGKDGNWVDKVVDKTKVALTNPSLITNTVVESVPSMLAGGVLGRASGIANPVIAGAAGEGAVMAGSQAEQIRQETVDGRLTADQSLAGATTGVLGGLIGFAGGRLAQKMGIGDVDTMLVTGRVGPAELAGEIASMPAKSLPRRVVEGAISEGFLEELPQSVSEQILQNLALDKPWHDGIEDAAVMGTLAGMAMGGAANIFSSHSTGIESQGNQQQSGSPNLPSAPPQLGLSPDSALTGEYIPRENVSEGDNNQGRTAFVYDQPSMEADNLLNNNYKGDAGFDTSGNFDPSNNPDSPLSPSGGNYFEDHSTQPQLPSERLGINPDDGPMSSAAALAVDTGASPVAQLGYTEQQQEQEQGNTPISDAVPSNYQSLLRSQNDGQPFDARFEDATVQQGNTQADNAGESISQQYDANAADAMGGGIETDRAKTTTAQTVQPILGQDGKNKWFGNQEKAQAFIDKKKLGNDYQVVQDGKRFEIQPKSQVAQTQNDNLNNQNSILNSQNTSLDAQNNTDKSQTSGIADQLAQLEQNFNAIKGNSLKQAIEKSKIKKQIDQLKSQQPEITTAPFGSEQIQKQYGDTAESVMSDVEILGDDFTIDLRDKNKKTNALNNPNYNAVQKADGSVEIVGMKHPTTGEWVGKKPNAMSIDENAHQAATSSQNNTPEPTQAQIEAGNYKKGHIKVHGLDISIENPKGSERRGTDPNGKEWAHTMSDHYGYIKRTKGADNEHIDTYIGNNPDSNQVFIVDQVDQESGNFDEHKVMLGFDSQEEAATAYKSNFDKGWKVGPIRNMDMEQFKDWLKNKDTSKPAIQKNVKDSIENIRAEKIRQKDLADMHNSVYGLATDEQLQESLKHLNKEIKKAQRQSENEVVNGKRSTRKAVASGALDRFLKNRVDLETYIKARKNGELKQRNKKIDDYSRDKLKPDNERKGVSPLDTTFISLSVVSATRRVLSVLQHLKMTATQDASFSGRINVSLNDRIRVNKVGDMNTYGFSVQVISSFSYLPKVIQNDATYQDENGKTQNYDVSGVWHDGTLYVVADQIYGDPEKQLTTFDAYEELLAHEIIGHFGVQRLFGQEYKTKLQQLYNALGKLEGIRKIASKNGVDMAQFESAYIEPYTQGAKNGIYAESDVQQALVGELFAFIAQNAKSRPFVRQKLKEVIGYIRQWFRDRGFDKFLSRYNDADLMMFLSEARKAVVDRSYFGKYKNQEFSSKNDSDTPLYSRRTESNTGSTTQQVRELLIDRFGKETIDELERQGKLEIIQDYQVEGVEGFYYNGKAVLVASNLTAESTVPTFLHELGGHAGFQNMMNQKQYDELMNQFNKLVEQGNPVAMAAKVLAEREQGSERQQLEYLPYLLTLSATMQQRNVLQRNALQKLINNIISYVKAWVFDHFGINLNLNPDDMLALSERMIGQIKHQSSLDLVRQKYQGTHQWMKAPNGAATHLSEQQWLQVRTPEFKKWFGDWENDAANASQVLDENGEPKVVYHGTASEFNEFKQGHGILGDGIYLTDSFDTADVYANIRGKNGFVLPLFVNIRNAFQTTANVSRDEIIKATSTGKYQGVIHHFDDQEYIVALEPNQVKMAEGNTGTFNSESADIRFSRSSNYDDITNRIANGFKNLPKTGDWINKKGVDWLKIGLGLLSRRHLTEVYGKLLPPLNKYNELAAQMDADKNDIAANADNIVREWSKLKDEEALANVMHDATLAQIDPAKPHQPGDDKVKYQQLLHAYNNLSPEAQAMYKRARNAYSGHYAKVREAIRERILRSALSSQKKADLLKNIEGSFGQIKGVYFPLARFGEYIIVMRNKNGDVESVSRAETNNEAESIRSELMKKYPQFKVDPVKLDKEYNASRDGVGRGFMSELFNEVENLGLSTEARAEFEDTLSQLYLSSMPDLSWAKHGIHRKGTAGFSQDARRAFAQHMFSGANYLGKLRYGDQLAQQLTDMQKHADNEFNKDIGYDQRSAQRVISEMEKRHELLMNPKGNPLSSFLTSVGFMYYMGLSPAAAMVNLSQTALIAYPIMGAKWGFDKAGKELLKASQDFGIGLKSGYKTPDFSNLEGFKNSVGDIYNPDIASILKGDELVAYEEAVKRGVIDVTQAHDLAGIAQGEDSKVMWYFRPAMRLASGMFHHAERFNREVTFIAAYRLARQHVSTNGSKATHSEAFEQAIDSVYKGHFDYSTGNRARFMQGNIAKVVLLFKQYAQNMIYILVRNAHQSIYALDPKEQKEARRALAGILGMTTLAAGAIGLPITGMLFTASVLIAKKSKLGSAAFFAAWAVGFFGAADGDDDDPYELEIVIRNWLADIHPKFADLVFGGLPRAFSPVDLSGRVGLNNLIFPDVQDGLEGADWAKGMQSALLGPVVGIGTNIAKGFQEINDGDYGRGIETMLPVVLKNAMKSMRFANEGVLTKNKDVIHNEEVTAVELFSQAIGFSPSDIKTSMEGRSAIYKYKTKLSKHRSELMHKWVVARQNDDSDGMNKAWAEILKFNENVSEKNPKMRINRMNLMQSYKATERKAKETGDGGVYLTKRQKGAEEQGGFAFNR